MTTALPGADLSRADIPSKDLPDAELLRRHLAGCTQSFAELVDRHRRLLAWTVRQANVPLDDRADVLQDGLLKIHRSAATFRGTGSAATWLCTIVRTTALSYLRSLARSPEELSRSVDQGESLQRIACERSVDAGQAVQRLVLHDAVRTLHPGLRDVFICTDINDWSLSRTASYLGVPMGTVKSRRARARAHLRRRLVEAGVAPVVDTSALESSA
jgi:RNA polymerase sigma-70 factor (ECF subfamily)